MDLIDPELTLSQFEALPPEIVAPLCDATAADLRDWGTRLLDAVAADDTDALRRARHSLKGLCGNFGAGAIMLRAEGDLRSADARAGFRDCIEATIAAVLAIAAPLIP
ncbi:Hpt domain-containing protein [Novosphingobium sp.]|uniref:Hpt domain-containing protein n=1 Tax=Novosphingobium sp. TaxID=1874826 RepID=UPI0033414258